MYLKDRFLHQFDTHMYSNVFSSHSVSPITCFYLGCMIKQPKAPHTHPWLTSPTTSQSLWNGPHQTLHLRLNLIQYPDYSEVVIIFFFWDISNGYFGVLFPSQWRVIPGPVKHRTHEHQPYRWSQQWHQEDCAQRTLWACRITWMPNN